MATKTVLSASADEIAEPFADYIEGDASRPAIAISSRPLADGGRAAIEKSLDALGYGEPACTFAVLEGAGVAGETGTLLDPQAIYLLVEGLDPLFVVVCDEPAAKQVAVAFRAAFDLDAPARLAGRPAAVFRDLTSLLETQEGKRTAWRVLKSLA